MTLLDCVNLLCFFVLASMTDTLERLDLMLRHSRDVHPTWVEGRVPCVILTSTGFGSDET